MGAEKHLKRILKIGAAAAAAGIAWSVFKEPYMLSVRSAQLCFNELPEEADGLRIALFSDLHIGGKMTYHVLFRVCEEINSMDPDIVLFAGDLIGNFEKLIQNCDRASGILSRISAKLGKYAVFGNHDIYGGRSEIFARIMTDGGFSILSSDKVKLKGRKVFIIGAEDYFKNVHCAEEVRLLAEPDEFSVILAHEPDTAPAMAPSGAALQLSGHTHAGQIVLPIYGPLSKTYMGKEYMRGTYDVDGMTLFVTSGIGNSVLPMRFGCTPEVCLITLKRGRL